MKDILAIHEVALILGISDQALRVRLQQNVYDFGAVIRMKGYKRKQYDIYRAKLEEHLGRKLTEEDFA